MYSVKMLAWYGLAGLLHALVGAAFIWVFTPYDPKWGAIGGIIPDLDVVFRFIDTQAPFVHRGITHTLFFIGLVVLVMWMVRTPEGTIHGVAWGMGLHLIFDTISGWGVMWFWPIQEWIHIPLHVNMPPKLKLLCFSLATLLALLPQRRRYHAIH